MTARLEDPEFGPLEMDIIWGGHASLPPLSDSVAMQISTLGRRPPEAWQREAFRRFKAALGPELMEKISDLIRRYLVRQGHHLEDPFTVLEAPFVFIPPVVDKRFDLVVQWKNNLDKERGLQVLFRGGVPVGTAEILDMREEGD